MKYIKAVGINYKNELKTISKSSSFKLQPVFEAFMNSWEAIIERFTNNNLSLGNIVIKIYITSGTFGKDESLSYSLDKIVVTDNGTGITDKGYQRLVDLRDNSKHLKNKGTGRIQFLHFFDKTVIDSVGLRDIPENGYVKRIITLSKSEAFLEKNSIMRLDNEELNIKCNNTYTTVSFYKPLDEKDNYFYSNIKVEELKNYIIEHFLSLLCDNINQLPNIKILRYIDKIQNRILDIHKNDIPNYNREDNIEIAYSRLDENNKISKTEKKARFKLKSFVLPVDKLPANSLILVSKGTFSKSISINNLESKDSINGNRYLFLLSSEYIDMCDDDTRGNLLLVTSKDFKNQNTQNFYKEEVVLLDDIEEESNKKIEQNYPEILESLKEKYKTIDELQKMFLLNPKTINSIKKNVKNTDSDEAILKLIYKAEAENVAKKDAELKNFYNKIEDLNTTEEEYHQQLNSIINEYVTEVPLRNRTELSKYIARRRIVLEIFSKILNKEMNSLKDGGRIDEDLLHNLILRQRTETNTPDDNDLWIINEDFIYFTGKSDIMLDKIEIDGVPLIKRTLTEEEKKYKVRNGYNVGLRRPDILLFPSEGKCIIIEFKAPDVNVSDHVYQITRYASLINNLSDDQFHFSTYYGYLIGENINIDDFTDLEDDFIPAYSLGYIVRPYHRIAGKFKRENGALYTEVIKYSDLLKRAQIRNKVFIDKLEADLYQQNEGTTNEEMS
jgi:hypothetical protein